MGRLLPPARSRPTTDFDVWGVYSAVPPSSHEVLAAQSLRHSQGALGGCLRRMKERLGAQAAVTATAHKREKIVYRALKHSLTYVSRCQDEYEAQMREKQVK